MNQLARPVWAKIDLENVAYNVKQIKSKLQADCHLMVVVKANGYGHGDLEIARTALANGASWLAVAIPEEGVRLRRASIASPILVLGALSVQQLEICVAKDLVLTVFQWEIAQALSNIARRLRKTVRIHVKVDTGMSRIGIPPEDAVKFIKRLRGLPGIEIQGIYTHFASADIPDGEYVKWQWQRFSWVLLELRKEGISIPLKHCANTAATLLLPETHLTMVRVGLGVYGLHSNETRTIQLKPAFSLHTEVAAVKRVPPGTAISYHSTYVTWKETNIITLPIGYADGVLRRLSNRAVVLVNGILCPIAGRITMDHCMVDVGDIEVDEGATVTLIGKQGDAEITVDDWARWLDTINYEIPCMISERVERVYH